MCRYRSSTKTLQFAEKENTGYCLVIFFATIKSRQFYPHDGSSHFIHFWGIWTNNALRPLLSRIAYPTETSSKFTKLRASKRKRKWGEQSTRATAWNKPSKPWTSRGTANVQSFAPPVRRRQQPRADKVWPIGAHGMTNYYSNRATVGGMTILTPTNHIFQMLCTSLKNKDQI